MIHRMLCKVAQIYSIFLTSEDKKFTYIEKIEDFFLGATFENGLLIFIKQQPWFSKDELYAAFKRAVSIVKDDFNNLFI